MNGGSNYIQTYMDRAIDLPYGEWALITASYDGSGLASGLTIYINGVAPPQTRSTSGTIGVINYLNHRLFVAGTDNSVQEFTGRMCHSFVANRATTPSEMAQLAAAGVPIPLGEVYSAAELVHWCTLGDGCTTGAGACPDLSSLGNNGTATNMTAAELAVTDVPPTEALADHSPLTTSLDFVAASEPSVSYPRATGNILDFPTPFTIGCWFKTTDTNTRLMVGRVGNRYFGDGEERGYRLEHRNGGIGLWVGTSVGTVRSFKWNYTSAAGLNDGTWHFVAMTFNASRTSPLIESLVDGEYRTNTQHTQQAGGNFTWGHSMDHATEPLVLGQQASGFGVSYAWFDGQICHAFIFNGVALDKYDLYRLWAEGSPQDLDAIVQSSLVSYWDTVGDGDTLGYERMIDLEAANNGTGFNLKTANPRDESPGGTYSTKSMVFGGGPGQYGNLGNVLNFERTDAFSWSFWLNPAQATSAEIVSNSAGAAGNYRGYEVYRVSDGRVGMALYSTYSTNYFAISTSGVVSPLGDWVHVVATYDGSSLSSGVTIYINGVSQAMGASAGDSLSTTIVHAGDLNFARRATDDTVRLYGYLDDIAVYDKELTGPEALAIYNSGEPGDLSLLSSWANNVGWWKMGHPSYQPLTTSIGFNGTFPYDEYGTFNSPLTIPPTGQAFTEAVWFKASVVTNHVLWSKSAVTSGRSWAIRITNNRAVLLYTDGSSTWNGRYYDAASTLLDGSWHFIAVVHNGSDVTNAVIYIDGTPHSTGGTSYPMDTPTADSRYVFGGMWGASTLSFPLRGQLCHGALYDKALSTAELNAIYGGGVPQDLSVVGPTSNLKHWCALGDGDAIGAGNLIDLSSAGIDGTYAAGESGDFVSDVPGLPLLHDSGNGTSNDGTYVGAGENFLVDVPFPNRRSVLFDGVDDNVDMGDVLDFDRFDAQSWAFWIKTTSSAISVLVHKTGAGDPSGWNISLNNTGTIVFSMVKVFITNDIVLESSFTVNDGNWHHIVVTWSGSTGTGTDGKMYKNGAVDVGALIIRNALTGSISNSFDFMLASYVGPAQPFAGNLDEVAVYSKELSAGEVSTIYGHFGSYGSGSTGADLNSLSTVADLRAWWRMGDGDTYPTLTDNSANSNDGVMNTEESDIVGDTPP
jgi:hypothetical protein